MHPPCLSLSNNLIHSIILFTIIYTSRSTISTFLTLFQNSTRSPQFVSGNQVIFKQFSSIIAETNGEHGHFLFLLFEFADTEMMIANVRDMK